MDSALKGNDKKLIISHPHMTTNVGSYLQRDLSKSMTIALIGDIPPEKKSPVNGE
jgi:hypothetical protein